MTPRRGWIFCLLVCLGCKVALPTDPGDDSRQSPAAIAPAFTAEAERPVGFFEPSLATLDQPARSSLSQAIAFLSEGNRSAACSELAKHLIHHPDHFEIRVHRAELLLDLERSAEAESEFSRAIADAQETGDAALALRVYCHRALKEIAETGNDDYLCHLHRGVGLYLVALQRARLPDPNGVLPVEGLLFKAAKELTQAHALRPREVRPCWYLHLAWSGLGQQTQSTKWLQRALATARFSALTSAEQRGLELQAIVFGTRQVRP